MQQTRVSGFKAACLLVVWRRRVQAGFYTSSFFFFLSFDFNKTKNLACPKKPESAKCSDLKTLP